MIVNCTPGLRLACEVNFVAMPQLQSKEIAERLGIHPVTLSRLRGGSREPSRALMVKINEVMEWSLNTQMRAYADGTYAEKLRAVMFKRFGVPDMTTQEDEEQ